MQIETKITKPNKHEEELIRLLESGDRKKIAKYYQDYFNLNRLVIYDYLKSFGVESIVDIDFVSENGELLEIKNIEDEKKGKKGVGTNVPTAVFTVERSKDGLGKSPHVYVGLDFFIKNGLSNKKALWVLLHELTHFKDYHVDPKAYMNNFSRMKGIAVNTTEKLEDEYFKLKGEKLNPKKKHAVTKNIERTLMSVYSNLVEDISVNHHVERLSWFKRGKGQNEMDVVELYEKLFKEKDLSNMPQAFQYLYALLISEFRGRANEGKDNLGLLGSGSRITDDVFSAISKDYKLKDGKTYTTKDIIDAVLNPNEPAIVENTPKQKLTRQVERHNVLDRTFLPTFLDLYVKDLLNSLTQHEESGEENNNENQQDDSSEDILKDLEDAIDDIEQNSPDFIDEEDMKEIFKEMESEDKKQKEDKKESGKPSKDKKPDPRQEWLKNNGFTSQQEYEVKDVENSIEKLITPLRNAWEMIKLNRQEIFKKVYGGSSTHGRFSVRNFTRDLGKIIKNDYENVRLFKRSTFEIEHIETPEEIEIQLIFDYSGSQFSGLISRSSESVQKKQLAMKQIFMMVSKSIAEFNEEGRVSAEDINLRADVGVIFFGSDAEEIIPFGEMDTKKEFNVLSFFKSIKNYGGTWNDKALELSLDRLSEEKRRKIKTKNLLRLAILITDGGGDENIQRIEEMKKKYKEAGIHLISFHIGGEQVREYSQKWKTDKNDKDCDGIIVDRIEELPSQISEYIVEVLNKVV